MSLSRFSLIDFLLLVERHLPWAHIDQKQQSSNNGEDLEEVVFGEILVRVVGVELLLPLALSLIAVLAACLPSTSCSPEY